ncbi:MAG: hypothetical protein ACI9FU_001668 [Granulosicoccus sp.]|jgi:hypothetical protein
MKLKIAFTLILVGSIGFLRAQSGYWQQHVSYQMEVDMDVETHRFTGVQKLVYTNNSPDTLNRVFYHLYFNAFQPESMMDVRSRTIADSDSRVVDRISKLKPDEVGYHKIQTLTQDGQELSFHIQGTVAEVNLSKPILPGGSTEFLMNFESQVPVQVRRSGRDNMEGISYSMTQWYPKMAEYDYEGWHADPYVGREFHGVWGDFDVKISIRKDHVLGGTGYLQNPEEVGFGYEKVGSTVNPPLDDKLTWHFKAPQVHDFAWAADPDYLHGTRQVPDGPMLHFLYQPDTTSRWDTLMDLTVEAFQIQSGLFGKYPYKQFSVIQGGDGGMEYPMATLITSHGSMAGLLSVTVHESLHNWYYGVLATNELKYSWMDEGFTTFAQYLVLDSIYRKGSANPHERQMNGVISLQASGLAEPATTHADHYHTNYAYGITSYHKGAVFLRQLQYIVGKKNFWTGMTRYFNEWGFKHPTPNDFIRIMEKISGLELTWYLDLYIGTTKFSDYGIKDVRKRKKGMATIDLERIGQMPMPVDVKVTDKDGNETMYHIPLSIMRGEKPTEGTTTTVVLPDWPWTHPDYSLDLDIKKRKVKSIEIDPSVRMVDMNRDNNHYPELKK